MKSYCSKIDLISKHRRSAEKAGYKPIHRHGVKISDVTTVAALSSLSSSRTVPQPSAQSMEDGHLSSMLNSAFIKSDLLLPRSRVLTPVDYKIWGINRRWVYQTKCRMWVIWDSIWLKCGLEYDRALLAMPLTGGAEVSMPAFEPEEDILNIHCDKN